MAISNTQTVDVLSRRAARKARLNELWFNDAFGNPQVNSWAHETIFELYERHKWLLLEMPREHGKTQAVAITLPLIEMKLNPNIRICLISDIHEKSAERARVLREHIETNEAYRALDPQINIVRKNGDYEFTVDRQVIVKEPTVRSTYSHAPIAGGRYDLLICDDVTSWLYNSNTAYKRDKLHRWFMDEVLNSVAPGGRVVVIGTRQTHDDEYERLKADQRFHAVAFPAIDESYRERNEVRGVTGNDALCLWPEGHDYESLMAKKAADENSFQRQQMLVAIPETGLVYQRHLVDKALERGKEVEPDPEATQLLCLDPGYGKRAALLAAQETTGDSVEVWKEYSFTQCHDDTISEVVVEHCRDWGVRGVYLDAADPGLGAAIKRDLRAAGLSAKVVPVPFGKYKSLSISAIRWLLSTGKLSLKGEVTTVYTPGRRTVEDSIFRKEIRDYALKEGEDDVPIKGDDHGPDALAAGMVRWIAPHLRATGQSDDSVK